MQRQRLLSTHMYIYIYLTQEEDILIGVEVLLLLLLLLCRLHIAHWDGLIECYIHSNIFQSQAQAIHTEGRCGSAIIKICMTCV